MSLTGRPSSPPFALTSSAQICVASRPLLPLTASDPVSAIENPIVIGSPLGALAGVWAIAEAASSSPAASAPATLPSRRRVSPITMTSPIVASDSALRGRRGRISAATGGNTLNRAQSGAIGKAGAASSAGAAQHRPEIAAAEQVQMEMRHLLVRRRAVIGEDAIAARDDAFLFSDLPDRPHERRQLGLRGVRGEIVDRDVRALRDDDDVGRRQ